MRTVSNCYPTSEVRGLNMDQEGPCVRMCHREALALKKECSFAASAIWLTQIDP